MKPALAENDEPESYQRNARKEKKDVKRPVTQQVILLTEECDQMLNSVVQTDDAVQNMISEIQTANCS